MKSSQLDFCSGLRLETTCCEWVQYMHDNWRRESSKRHGQFIIAHSDLGTQALKSAANVLSVEQKPRIGGYPPFPINSLNFTTTICQAAGWDCCQKDFLESNISLGVWSHASPVSCVIFNILNVHFRAMAKLSGRRNLLLYFYSGKKKKRNVVRVSTLFTSFTLCYECFLCGSFNITQVPACWQTHCSEGTENTI